MVVFELVRADAGETSPKRRQERKAMPLTAVVIPEEEVEEVEGYVNTVAVRTQETCRGSPP